MLGVLCHHCSLEQCSQLGVISPHLQEEKETEHYWPGSLSLQVPTAQGSIRRSSPVSLLVEKFYER